MSLRHAVAAIAATLVLAAAGAAQAQLKPEEVLKLRQGLMVGQKTQLGPLGAVAKGEAPLGDEAVVQADNLASLAKMAPLGFPPDSADLKPSKAKPDIWQKQDEFRKVGLNLIAQTEKLAEAAKSKNLDAFKAQFQETAKACKTCHDTFRSE